MPYGIQQPSSNSLLAGIAREQTLLAPANPETRHRLTDTGAADDVADSPAGGRSAGTPTSVPQRPHQYRRHPARNSRSNNRGRCATSAPDFSRSRAPQGKTDGRHRPMTLRSNASERNLTSSPNARARLIRDALVSLRVVSRRIPGSTQHHRPAPTPRSHHQSRNLPDRGQVMASNRAIRESAPSKF